MERKVTMKEVMSSPGGLTWAPGLTVPFPTSSHSPQGLQYPLPCVWTFFVSLCPQGSCCSMAGVGSPRLVGAPLSVSADGGDWGTFIICTEVVTP